MGEQEIGSEVIANREHIAPAKTGDNIAAKRVVGYNWNPSTSLWERPTQNSGLIPVPFNRITFSNADANGNYQTGTVKKSGTTVGILTLAYDSNSNLTDIQFN